MTSRWLAFFIASLALICAFRPTTSAAIEMGIVTTVDGAAITSSEIQNRVRWEIAQAGLPDRPEVRARLAEDVHRNLIEELLKMNEAKRRGIEVSERQLERAVSRVERRLGLPPGTLNTRLQQLNLPRKTLYAKVESDIAWRRLVEARFSAQARVSDEDVEAEIARLDQNRGRLERRVSEIFLAVNSAQEEQQKRQVLSQVLNVLQNRQLPFDAIARRVSESTTKNAGGSLGWVFEGTLIPAFESALSRMSPGDISEPIQTDAGFYLLRLDGQRASPGSDLPAQEPDTTVALTFLLVPIPQGAPPALIATQKAKADDLKTRATSCDAMSQLGPETRSLSSGNRRTIKLSQMNPNLRGEIARLPVGTSSDVRRLPTGFEFYMVCERTEDPVVVETDEDKRVRVRSRLTGEALVIRDRQYLRDLRRQANIENIR